MMRKHYETYSQIPPTVQDYILTVSGKKHIMTIPLTEINVFLDELHRYYESKQECHEDGWVV